MQNDERMTRLPPIPRMKKKRPRQKARRKPDLRTSAIGPSARSRTSASQLVAGGGGVRSLPLSPTASSQREAGGARRRREAAPRVRSRCESEPDGRVVGDVRVQQQPVQWERHHDRRRVHEAVEREDAAALLLGDEASEQRCDRRALADRAEQDVGRVNSSIAPDRRDDDGRERHQQVGSDVERDREQQHEPLAAAVGERSHQRRRDEVHQEKDREQAAVAALRVAHHEVKLAAFWAAAPAVRLR